MGIGATTGQGDDFEVVDVRKFITRLCWICGDPADSAEHRRKRSDLVTRYGPSWTPERQPFVIRGDSSDRWTRIQGPNDRANLYEEMLCRPCNSTRTKSFDKAYQRFSDWLFAAAPVLHSKHAIEFEEVYGKAYIGESQNLLRYFAKSLGCRIVAAGIKPPDGLRRIITDTSLTDVRPLVVTFAINDFWRRVDPTGRIIADDHFNSWPEISHKQCFSWMQMLGYVEIFYWYDLEWADGYPFGGDPMSEARRAVTLGYRDPLPDEPAASMRRSDFPP